MAIPVDIVEFVEKHIKLMISQTETYLPFIRVAFPYSNNIADGVYNLIIGSALSIFVNQFAMKMKYPTAEDFTVFGKISLKFRDQVDQFFK
ncbi:MAG: hypothetical protein HQ505_08420 [Nitrosopumilus sp.]|nr:hypothetical protein [Nitrosopumilus sp.]